VLCPNLQTAKSHTHINYEKNKLKQVNHMRISFTLSCNQDHNQKGMAKGSAGWCKWAYCLTPPKKKNRYTPPPCHQCWKWHHLHHQAALHHHLHLNPRAQHPHLNLSQKMHTEMHQRTHHLLAQSLGQFTSLMRIVILTDELQRLVEVLFRHNPHTCISRD
jgi:hypothetical protein